MKLEDIQAELAVAYAAANPESAVVVAQRFPDQLKEIAEAVPEYVLGFAEVFPDQVPLLAEAIETVDNRTCERRLVPLAKTYPEQLFEIANALYFGSHVALLAEAFPDRAVELALAFPKARADIAKAVPQAFELEA